MCKHAGVKKIVQCEIDEGVVNAAKKFFPSIAKSFADPRVELIIDDAVAYVANAAAETFDVIIVDSSDPVGPAEKLFSPEFYENASRILTKDGIMSTQGECLWLHHDLMKSMLDSNCKSFKSAEYASIQTPTYPCGQICAFTLSKSRNTCKVPGREPSKEMEPELNYYCPEMHRAAFVLPMFLRRKLEN